MARKTRTASAVELELAEVTAEHTAAVNRMQDLANKRGALRRELRAMAEAGENAEAEAEAANAEESESCQTL